MKKIIVIITSSIGGLVVIGLVLLIPIFIVLDFFGANITDGYVENNSLYSSEYLNVLNKYLKDNLGYVSLERILYFYLEDSSLSFDEIYFDNLDTDTKRMLPISDVCLLDKYKILGVCKSDNLSSSNQVDEEVKKPFAPPIDFASSTITSFFMQERIVYGVSDVHSAWDIANSANTSVYSVCDGKVEEVSFSYTSNTINVSGGAGNSITIICEVEDVYYKVLYGHLYPNSTTLKAGDIVTKGDKIAGVGTTGYSTGNHLHFQVSVNNDYVDGMSLIDFTYENTNITPSYKINDSLYYS